jgi:thiaminase/transcriptional activator TenA
LALVGTKAADDDTAVELFANAAAALSVERAALHEFLMAEWGLERKEVYSTPMNMVNAAYTSYLLSTAYGRPFHEALAAILSCFWVYGEVGKELLRKGSPNPTYQKWIATYSSDEYARAVEKAIVAMEEESTRLTLAERGEAKRHFRRSTLYEYLFWDAAYRREQWPFEP